MTVLCLFNVLYSINLLFMIAVTSGKKKRQSREIITQLLFLLHFHICNCAAHSPSSAKINQ